MAARAFLLNFDAEHELARPTAYQPQQAVQARFTALTQRLGNLLGPSDVVVTSQTQPGSLRGYRGIAWCPTPRALTLLQQCGAELPNAPSLAILQRVTDRRFGVELNQGPLPSHYVTSLEDALSLLNQGSETNEWLAKRSFSFAARGHRILTSTLSTADRGFLRNSFGNGHGIVLEPRVKRLLDCSIHGILEPSGTLHLGHPVIQHCDDQGAWLSAQTATSTELHAEEQSKLLSTATRVAEALHSAGYFGPFGIDAFRYQTAEGLEAFRPLVEINPRLTMGFAASHLAARL